MGRGSWRRPSWSGGILVLALLACTTGSEENSPPLIAAKGEPSAAGDPVVEATDPPMAPQDTTVDVRVLGSGFDRGSTVEMLIDGLPTSKVITNRTRYKNQGELIATLSIAVDAPVVAYDVAVTTSRGKKGIGIEKFAVTEKIHPQLIPATFELPVSSGGNGLFADGQGDYPGTLDDTGRIDAQAICADGRRFVLTLPSAWSSQLAAGAAQHCTLPDGFSQHRLDLNYLVNCPDGTSCPNGTTGHTTGTNFGPDLHYYWSVVTPKPKGKGTIVYAYNIVWTDGTYRVTRWAGGIANGTACGWRIVASRAELWEGSPTLRQIGTAMDMPLDAGVERTDSACGP